VWALHRLWHELGFDRLHVVFRQERYTAPVEQAIRLMVFNRLCDADSKLGALRWLKTVALPDVQAAETTHQHLLRTDALMDHQAAVDECVAQLLRPLIDDELSVVFYDLTTIRVEGLSEQSGELRKFGMSKEEITARQFLLGVVQTADGLPIYHELAVPSHHAAARSHSRIYRVVAVQFTPTGALPVGTAQGSSSDA